MKKTMFSLMLCTVAAGLVLNAPLAVAATQKEKKTSPATQIDKPGKAAADSSLSGKVVETMNASGYTYVCLEKNGKKTWVAVPEMKVAVGREMAFLPGGEMRNFESKTLKRTFESIIFSGGPITSSVQAASSALPPGHKDVAESKAGSKAAASSKAKNVKVEKATGADAYTVADVYAKQAILHKKTVVVKGKVVKVSLGIMGKNWIHVQDGTGDAKKGTHNLVVTTDAVAEVGDVVTVKGTVFKDKDFGAGYKYDVIMETATVTKQ